MEYRNNNVAAVVVTYNRKQLLVECVEALLDQTIELANITIIDNNSTDGTTEILEEKGFLEQSVVNYVKLPKNVGGAGGFYEGLRLLKDKNFDWIWIMDDDTIPKKNALEELLSANELISSHIETEKSPSFLASAVYGEKGEVMNVPQIDLRSAENGYSYWYKLLEHGIVNIRNATFVSILVKGSAIKNVGLPCREYFIWGDDSEYTERLVKYIGDAYMVGKSVVVHKRKNARSLSILNEEDSKRMEMYHYMFRNQLINEVYYYGKKAGIKKVIRDIKVMFLGMKKPSRWKIMKQVIYGDYQALIQYKKFSRYITQEIQKNK